MNARQAPAAANNTEGKSREGATFAKMADIEDLERIRRALRAGAQAVQVEMRDAATRGALHPTVIAYEADGGVLELAKHGRVTRLGRLWDQERARSRSPTR